MSITFENEANFILWTLPKLLAMFEQRQYIFAAQSIWWIAGLVQSDPALQYFLMYRKFPKDECDHNEEQELTQETIERSISPTPRDIQQ